MIELYIDGQAVILPEDFSFTAVFENPLLTKNGEYTLDITIDLDNPTNAKIWGFANRINSTKTFANRRAILLKDSRVVLSGVENVIEITDKSVSIQLIAGNSELNFIGSDLLINELDLGGLSLMNETIALASLGHSYPDIDYVCCPIKSSESVYNNFFYQWVYPNGDLQLEPVATQKVEAPFAIQPYVLGIVYKIFDNLGYTLVGNELLENDIVANILNKIYIVSKSESLEYKDALPSWTVSFFISEFEKLTNSIFLINPQRREFSILSLTNYYSQNIVVVNDMVDDFTMEFDDSATISNLDYDNVAFNLDSNFDSYASVGNLIYEKCEIFEYQSFSLLKTYLEVNYNSHKNKKHIFKVLDSKIDYIVVDAITPILPPTPTYSIKPINILGQKGIKDNVSFNIVPANIFTFQPLFRNSQYQHIGFSQAPEFDFTKIEGDDISIVDLIENGISEKSINDALLPISIYFGMECPRNSDGDIYLNPDTRVPFSQNDSYYQLTTDYNVERIHYSKELEDQIATLTPLSTGYAQMLLEKQKQEQLSLRLNGQRGIFHLLQINSTAVDTSRKLVIDFIEKKIDPSALFIINNRKFVCENIEKKITQNNESDIVTGYFYPLV